MFSVLHIYLFNMKYFKYSFNIKIVQGMYSEQGRSWGLRNTVDSVIRLYYVAGGGGRAVCGKQHIALEAGKFYLLPSQTPLTFWTTEKLDLHWMHVQLTLAPGIDIFNIIKGEIMSIPEPESSLLERFKALHGEGDEMLSGDLRRQAVIMEIIAVFFQRYKVELPELFEKDLKRFEVIIGLIEKYPGRKWTIQELADKTGLRRVRFSTEFRRFFGISPAKFIMRKRLEYACYLLSNSDRILEDIADELGFCNAFHFSKSFKSGMGVSPKIFRANRDIIQP